MEEMEGLKICLNCLWFSPRIKKGGADLFGNLRKRYGSSWKITQLQKFHFQKGIGIIRKKGGCFVLKRIHPPIL